MWRRLDGSDWVRVDEDAEEEIALRLDSIKGDSPDVLAHKIYNLLNA